MGVAFFLSGPALVDAPSFSHKQDDAFLATPRTFLRITPPIPAFGNSGRQMNSSGDRCARLLSRRGTRRGFLAGAASAACAATTAVSAEDQAQRNLRLAREHLDRRLPAIRAALAEATSGFVFLAGNSHAEIVGTALARWMPVVNGGIGGTSARGYAAQLDALVFGARAGTAVLFVGTNDILRRADPLSEATRSGFEAAAVRILDWLCAHADRVLVAAVPPLGPEAAAIRDPAAVDTYTAALRSLCEQRGRRFSCRFFDPFAGLRNGEPGLTTQAAPPDGVHLRDYDSVAAELAALMTVR
ncbi:SGNH/GDSL hydrolase family protein [Methylobacterium gregans]|uniref:SGNH/GDSL hydrolase family protein n=2 Tax=Methylobacterium gregans TaxID=374424 RepID=UPI001EE18B87|nr:GDSL-type esterase/lipase family protein [Methylobacterium gregans]